jgi:alkanesulfonate monooxygenase SsuD/methylene tetrahydromethanopterin reductase-like flavin-dependent oxidoreductase (luciferase family)
MGPLGTRHAAEWADGWFPVDFALLPDVTAAVAAFRAQVREAGRDPDSVPITLQAMLHPTLDDLKRYRDAGIARVNVGVSIDLWDKPEAMLPMIDEYAELIPQL